MSCHRKWLGQFHDALQLPFTFWKCVRRLKWWRWCWWIGVKVAWWLLFARGIFHVLECRHWIHHTALLTKSVLGLNLCTLLCPSDGSRSVKLLYKNFFFTTVHITFNFKIHVFWNRKICSVDEDDETEVKSTRGNIIFYSNSNSPSYFPL